MRARWAWLFVALLAGLVFRADLETAGPRPAVIGYLFPQDQLLDPAQIAADKLTHINYAFANLRDGQVVEGFARDAENFAVLAAVRRSHPHLKVLVSVGGWTWSKGFSDAVLTPKRRRRFVESAVAFVRRHDLDGFDVDWEYPGLPGDGNTHRPEDKANFTAVMSDLRSALDKDAAARGRTALLTFAAGAFPAFIDNTEMAKVQASVDFVNLMTYDFRVASVDARRGPSRQPVRPPVRRQEALGRPRGARVPGRGRARRQTGHGRALLRARLARRAARLPTASTSRARPSSKMNLAYGRLAADVVGRDGFARKLGRRRAGAVSLERRPAHLHQLRRPGVDAAEGPVCPG